MRNLTLLYVEDDDDVRRNAVEYLSRLCKEVYEARDGKEALQLWKAEQPDIIISDINMPRLNGIDMARYIRAHDTKTQIIIATAYSETDYLLQAVELQLVKYIVKPLSKEKLLGALTQSIARIEDKSRFSLLIAPACEYNAYTQTVNLEGELLKLTKNERLFLDLLVRHHTRVVTYEEIEAAVWPYEGMSSDALRSLVRALRKKLPAGSIENISGCGYKLLSL